MRKSPDPGTPQTPRLRWIDAAWVLPVVLAAHVLVLGGWLRASPGERGSDAAGVAWSTVAPAGGHRPMVDTTAADAGSAAARQPPEVSRQSSPSPLSEAASPRPPQAPPTPTAPEHAAAPRPDRHEAAGEPPPTATAIAPPAALPALPLSRDGAAPPSAGPAQAGPARVTASPAPSPGVTPGGEAGAAPVPSAATGADDPLPTYAVRVPPAFSQRFGLRRGEREGQAELVLEREGARYTMSLRGWIDGAEVLGHDSRGGFDTAGLAPERFVERQRGRDRIAANFDPVRRRITYSGPAQTHAFAPGTQDRLSWLVQLAAIVSADPSRFAAGTEIVLAVSGARADLDRWRFAVGAPEPLALADGRLVSALPLKREPTRPYDLRVQVWLDPARNHLPALVRLSVVPGGGTLELLAEPGAAAAAAAGAGR